MNKPTIEDIRDYMIEKGCETKDEPESFFDYFESNGWMVGKHKMKCWKAATRTWLRNAKKWSKRNANNQSSTHADRQREEAARIYSEMEQANGSSGFGAVCPTGGLIRRTGEV
jgi:hypothetical protein